MWAGPDRQVCAGDTILLGVSQTMPPHCISDPYCFRWEPAHLILPGDEYELQPRAIPTQDTWFVIYMTDGQGNILSDSVFVAVIPGPVITSQPADASICSGGSHTLSLNATGGNPSLTYQ
ncbi:MAG: hypothetical protein KF852_00560 [Saprospiraceae bacterium]|nr:hypothetical protein [Saprospiraceae bacterium]